MQSSIFYGEHSIRTIFEGEKSNNIILKIVCNASDLKVNDSLLHLLSRNSTRSITVDKTITLYSFGFVDLSRYFLIFRNKVT